MTISKYSKKKHLYLRSNKVQHDLAPKRLNVEDLIWNDFLTKKPRHIRSHHDVFSYDASSLEAVGQNKSSLFYTHICFINVQLNLVISSLMLSFHQSDGYHWLSTLQILQALPSLVSSQHKFFPHDQTLDFH